MSDLQPLVTQKNPCFEYELVFRPSVGDIPKEVHQALRELWADYEAANGVTVHWDSEEMEEDYPVLRNFFKEHGVERCQIIWNW